jgi:CubicO group peptidase (beta-lactamase class C family)
MRTSLLRLTVRVLAGLFVGGVAVPMAGPVARPAWSAPADCGNPTPAALADFFDTAVPDRLAHDRVPGAVVSVVAGGRTVFAKGYGLADVEHNVAFDPARSLVRIASITKLFTWTAVMQQVEAGRLDLNADVNTYLTAFKIPSTYPEPVTLQTLMNHTAGFEDRIIGTGARTPADVAPLGRYLADNMPARIRRPGEISAYSNYGAALAGYIVSQASGEPYDRYIQHHLFEPLGMAHSTATEPVPATLAADLARSYNSDTDPPRPVAFEFDQLTPDGAISATAADMANFMNAHLNGGRFGASRILAPATTARMHERSFAADPRLGGYAHGFMERPVNGHRVLLHDGSWEDFESALELVPGCDLGLFVSANGTGGIDAFTEVMRTFFDRFAPTRAVPEAAAAPVSTAQMVTVEPRAGFYQPTRHNASTIEKLVTLLGPARLTVGADGTVHFRGTDWAPQGDGVYRRADGTDHLAFGKGPGGERYVATDGRAYELMSRGETPTFNLVILLAFAVVSLSALAVPVAGLWRRAFRWPGATRATWRVSRSLAAGAAVLGLAFLVMLGVELFGDTGAFLYGVPLGFRLLLVLPIVVLVMAGAAGVCTAATWRESGAGIVARVHQVALFAGLAALAWFCWQWNLIGWQFA